MNEPIQGATLGALFLAGLAGSLHCLAMCGPILLAFQRALTAPEAPAATARASFATSIGYHAGRLWTYAVLGFAAGWLGSRLRVGAELFGWQRPLAALAAFAVLAVGLIALGVIPGLRLDLKLPESCLPSHQRHPWLAALVAERRASARLLLGALMGLLPCGLVYGALILASTLPSPLYSALGMLCFGLGTFPALTALTALGRAIPRKVLALTPHLTAVLLLAAGLVMLIRASHPAGHH